MKLIGAGLPRTATLTQKIALEMLGLGPCYHMVNVLSDLELVHPWRAALDGQADWEELLGGFQSSVDWPGSYYYRELMDAYPDAKVLLSVRDAEGWERSMRSTILEVLTGDSLVGHLSAAAADVEPNWRAYNEMMRTMWTRLGVLDAHGAVRDDLVETFHRHNDEVRESVPAGRLLEWRPSDGWEPLCDFLEVPVPDAPLPRVNDTASFIERVLDMSLGTLDRWREQRDQEASASEPAQVAMPAG